MNDPIDIVVTYVNQKNKEWQKLYNKYKNTEISEGTQTSENKQAFGAERYRDWNTFRFWFRAIEKNCPWINKVFLILMDETHIPFWLDTNHPKLKIIYHKDYIPEGLLPTFNIMPIEMYYYKIPELSNNFITSNDDFFFLNSCTEDMFFENNKCVLNCVENKVKHKNSSQVWEQILANNDTFILKYYGNKLFRHSHLFEPRQKKFEEKIVLEHYDEIYNSFLKSKFRHSNNYLSWLFIDIMKNTTQCINRNSYSNSNLIELKQGINLDQYKNLQMVCFNDTENTHDFIKLRLKLWKFLYDKFPEKSSFELTDISNKTLKVLSIGLD